MQLVHEFMRTAKTGEFVEVGSKESKDREIRVKKRGQRRDKDWEVEAMNEGGGRRRGKNMEERRRS